MQKHIHQHTQFFFFGQQTATKSIVKNHPKALLSLRSAHTQTVKNRQKYKNRPQQLYKALLEKIDTQSFACYSFY
ncbi:hypothetical protein CVU75_03245 [Candidatus Dependentiae bacterium HGW-Dependentiae-1]|nr:MAG: hypothetical protein CVU75_03245 [Candidatus Dependentiae bacterium HGW-Dependentiae-1]